MYDEYVKQCQSLIFLPASVSMYRHIFNTEFNIGFHKPLKDQCDFCVNYSLKDDNDRIKMKNEYDRHMKNKDLARDSKEMDKNIAQTSSEHCCACFDLQQVIMLVKCILFKKIK